MSAKEDKRNATIHIEAMYRHVLMALEGCKLSEIERETLIEVGVKLNKLLSNFFLRNMNN